MRTTVRLADTLLARAEERAAQERRTLASLIEEELSTVPERPGHQGGVLPVSKARGGVQPGVDLNSNAALLDLLDER